MRATSFLGIDIMVTSMLVNFLLMCVTVLTLPRRNPDLASRITVFKSVALRNFLAFPGSTCSSVAFLVIHIRKDLQAEVDAWYFHSTPVWLIVMSIATLIFFRELK